MSHTDVVFKQGLHSRKVASAGAGELLSSPVHSLPCKHGGFFLLHYPWGRPRLPLAVAMPL